MPQPWHTRFPAKGEEVSRGRLKHRRAGRGWYLPPPSTASSSPTTAIPELPCTSLIIKPVLNILHKIMFTLTQPFLLPISFHLQDSAKVMLHLYCKITLLCSAGFLHISPTSPMKPSIFHPFSQWRKMECGLSVNIIG